MEKRNIIIDFTQEEVDFYLRYAGFTTRERTLFLFRQDEGTLEEATEALNCSLSTVNRVNKTMKKKIIKVAQFYYPGISKEWK